MEEIWRDIVGYEGRYQVSNYGRVRSLDFIEQYKKLGKVNYRKKNGTIIKQELTNSGYYVVNLHKNGKLKRNLTHRLVAQMFVPNPLKKLQINHKNGNKLDNHSSNLEWATGSENIRHAQKTGLLKNQKPIVQLKNGIVVAFYESIEDMHRKTGFTKKNVRNALNGKRGNSHGYQWVYKKDYCNIF
jgi:hypothetical protein